MVVGTGIVVDVGVVVEVVEVVDVGVVVVETGVEVEAVVEELIVVTGPGLLAATPPGAAPHAAKSRDAAASPTRNLPRGYLSFRVLGL